MAPVDQSKCKNKTYKKSRDLANVCTFEACQSICIPSAAERKGDSSMLHILNGVNGDLIAAEAKYHKNCFATYVSKKSTLCLAKGDFLTSSPTSLYALVDSCCSELSLPAREEVFGFWT